MQITSPVLLLDEEKCRANIQRMAQKATRNGLIFLPHFKTHQSATIGEWFREEGVSAITVSSVGMATYFAEHGWDNITIAVPCNIREIDAINELTKMITLNLFVASEETVRFLKKKVKHPVGIYLEIDTGQHRTGFLPDDYESLEAILDTVHSTDLLQFQGFYSHPGHTYQAKTTRQIIEIHRQAIASLGALKQRYRVDFPDLRVCIGDTPGCSVNDDFQSVDEMSPGNFVFYDGTQQSLGACSWDQVAVVAACPVIAAYPERNEMVIYGGAIHLSKDSLIRQDNSVSYGAIVDLDHDHWGEPMEGAYVSAISQEHGVIRMAPDQVKQIRVGDILGVVPVHSCLTANLFRKFQTLAGSMISMM